MVGRFTGACLGLLAFSVAVVSGLVVHNPPAVVLSRAIGALVVFCLLGLALGSVAHAIVREHARRRERELLGDAARQSTQETETGSASDTGADADADLPSVQPLHPRAQAG